MIRGYVTFEVGEERFAAPVDDVREIVRVAPNDLLPASERTLAGRELALVDVRRRTIPLLDLRTDRTGPGEAILPRRRALAGLVVDRVTAVVPASELLPQEASALALPSYALGVLRPAPGGAPLLLVGLPEVAAAGTGPAGEPALGAHVPLEAGAYT